MHYLSPAYNVAVALATTQLVSPREENIEALGRDVDTWICGKQGITSTEKKGFLIAGISLKRQLLFTPKTCVA